MNPASQTSLYLARELLAQEAARGKIAGGRGRRSAATASSHADHAARVCEKLQVVLTAFAGTAGFRSLLTRALTLAKAQEPSLAPVQVLEDGSLAGFETLGSDSSTGKSGETAVAGGQVLVAQLLDLLFTFIGEALTHQLLHSAWANIPTGALRSRTKDTP